MVGDFRVHATNCSRGNDWHTFGTASTGLMFLVVVAVGVGVKTFLFKVVLPVVGVLVLAAQYANGDTHAFWSICCGISTLSLVMLGFYLMISGLFHSKR